MSIQCPHRKPGHITQCLKKRKPPLVIEAQSPQRMSQHFRANPITLGASAWKCLGSCSFGMSPRLQFSCVHSLKLRGRDKGTGQTGTPLHGNTHRERREKVARAVGEVVMIQERSQKGWIACSCSLCSWSVMFIALMCLFTAQQALLESCPLLGFFAARRFF